MTTSPAPIITTARTITATLLAGLASASAQASRWEPETAHADPIEVKAGLTCDEDLSPQSAPTRRMRTTRLYRPEIARAALWQQRSPYRVFARQ